TPVRWRPEVLPRLPIGAKTVVCPTFLRVLEHLIGFADLLKAGFGIGLFADVRVILACKAPICALDLILRCGAGNTEDLIIVLELHRDSLSKERRYHPSPVPIHGGSDRPAQARSRQRA